MLSNAHKGVGFYRQRWKANLYRGMEVWNGIHRKSEKELCEDLAIKSVPVRSYGNQCDAVNH